MKRINKKMEDVNSFNISINNIELISRFFEEKSKKFKKQI